MILYSGLTSVIGKPEEYATNKTNGTFPDSYDIRIPTAPRHETVETSAFEDVEIKDLSQPHTEQKQEEHYDGFQYEEPVQASPVKGKGYLPVKALNTFSNDWAIKVRVTRKHPIKSWKNAAGEGELFNVDLIDMEGT